jgi:hypothetical protein
MVFQMTNPIITVVTGSVYRHTALIEMVKSARAAAPYGVPLSFIVVTITEDVKTIEWCNSQPDVRVIAQDGLKGAIRAFNEGCEAAVSDYVLMSNDDLVFLPYSITIAARYLEQHPTCGAVAFADNRPYPGKHEDGTGYGVQPMRVQGQDPKIYAQVGLFRTWLGNVLGWWGANDPIMGKGHTYGGDNYLSARILEAGYTVDAVYGAKVRDLIIEDDLRRGNYEAEQRAPAKYYERYPEGPRVASKPMIEPRDKERLRVLYLPVFEPNHPHQKTNKHGLLDALARKALVWQHDYVNESTNLTAMCKAWRPDLLLLQCHGTDKITAAHVASAKAAHPDMLVVNWNGDVWGDRLLDAPMIDLLRECDVQLVVNKAVLPVYEREGIYARYWQCAYEPLDFDTLPRVDSLDLALLANCYSEKRKELGKALLSVKDMKWKVYGSGWNWSKDIVSAGNTTYDFAQSAAVMKAAKLIIGDNQFPDDYGFVSNRVFDTLAADGGLLLHQHVPGMKEELGLISGVHYIAWNTLDELPNLIRYWLRPENAKDRRKIAAAGARYVRGFHTFDARVRELFFDILPAIQEREGVK